MATTITLREHAAHEGDGDRYPQAAEQARQRVRRLDPDEGLKSPRVRFAGALDFLLVEPAGFDQEPFPQMLAGRPARRNVFG